MRSTLTRRSALVASFALVAAGLAATPAVAADATTTKIGPGQIAPVENGDTYNTWHQGNPAATSGTYAFTTDGLRLRGKNQILTGDEALAAKTLAGLLESLGVTSEGADPGELWYQLPLFYGATDNFTTLRKDVTSDVDGWTTSRAITDAAGAELVAKGATKPLAEIVAAIEDADEAADDVTPLGYGVYSDVGSDVTVRTVSIDGRTTEFVAQAPAASSEHVTVGGIAAFPETEENFGSWHQGHWDPTKIGTQSFTTDGLRLT
ncbi:hypothetical protein IGS67_11550, partial [Flavimobilis sp. GY10621]